MLSFQTILFTPYKTYLLEPITFLLCLKTESCRKIGVLGRRIPCNLGNKGKANDSVTRISSAARKATSDTAKPELPPL